jgi:hypothetical protein
MPGSSKPSLSLMFPHKTSTHLSSAHTGFKPRYLIRKWPWPIQAPHILGPKSHEPFPVFWLYQRSVQARSICKRFVIRLGFKVRSCEHLAQTPSWKTTPCWPSETAYLIYSQLVIRLGFKGRSCEHLAQTPSWRTTPCRLSETAYLIYSQLVIRLGFKGRNCKHLAQTPSWRTTPCRLSETAYSIYSQLASKLEGVPPPEGAPCRVDRGLLIMGLYL